MATPSTKYRFTADTLEQIAALAEWYDLNTGADAVRYAVSRLYVETKKDIEKNMRKADKTA
jgi:hypothetical protein